MMIGPEQGKKPSGKSGKRKNKAKKAKRLAAEIDLATPTAHEDHLTGPVVAASDPVEPAFGLASAVDPQPASRLDGASPSDPVPDAGPQLLAWIDRVQARVDHLLTLVDPASETPTAVPEAAVATPEPEAAPEPVAGPTTVTTPPEADRAIVDGEQSEIDAEATSLAEAWARRQQTAEASVVTDDEPLESAEPAATSEDDEALEAEATAATDDVTPLEPTVIVAIEQLLDSPEPEPEPEPVIDDEPFEPVDARLTAILVARELIARGQSPADVRRRLRDGYGVIDPDAVLAQIAA